MSTKAKVGLITYHAAYNFGSVLQAYGTVRTIESLGYDVETLDYQTPSQQFWYHTDFSTKKGIRTMLETIGFKFIKKDRQKRAEKYEQFISSYLRPTTEKYTRYEDFSVIGNKYDILVSGSDQVWNIGCGEFRNEPGNAILPYFLQFGNPQKRVAYASSFGGQTIRGIRRYAEQLKSYDSLSTREPIIKRYMESVTGREVELVCDPTWLLDKKEWMKLPEIFTPKTDRPYIFVYALYWPSRILKRWLNAVKQIARKNNWDVYCISPLNYHKDSEVHMLQDAGPIDFLSYLANAQLVVTNTFHGTIFSVNFERPFYSCSTNAGSRQAQMLELCNLEDRIINSPSELADATDFDVDFTNASHIINTFRENSKKYLETSLS